MAGFFSLRQAGELLHYNAPGSGNYMVLYQLNGYPLHRLALASGQGYFNLQDIAPSRGLYIATIEQQGVVKSRMLVVK